MKKMLKFAGKLFVCMSVNTILILAWCDVMIPSKDAKALMCQIIITLAVSVVIVRVSEWAAEE